MERLEPREEVASQEMDGKHAEPTRKGFRAWGSLRGFGTGVVHEIKMQFVAAFCTHALRDIHWSFLEAPQHCDDALTLAPSRRSQCLKLGYMGAQALWSAQDGSVQNCHETLRRTFSAWAGELLVAWKQRPFDQAEDLHATWEAAGTGQPEHLLAPALAPRERVGGTSSHLLDAVASVRVVVVGLAVVSTVRKLDSLLVWFSLRSGFRLLFQAIFLNKPSGLWLWLLEWPSLRPCEMFSREFLCVELKMILPQNKTYLLIPN